MKTKILQDDIYKHNNLVNIQAEESILGAIILAGIEGDDGIFNCITLSETDFYLGSHQRIFHAMTDLNRKGVAIDLISLGDILSPEDTKKVITISKDTVTSANVEYHAEIIKDLAQTRSVKRLCLQIAGAIDSGSLENSDGAVARLSRGLINLIKQRSKGIMTMAEIAQELDTYVERRLKTLGGVSGIPSGFLDLDKLTDGWQPGDLICLAGRPSKGKSALGMAFVENAAKEGYPCGVISIEMGAMQIGMRTLSSISQIEKWRIAKGKINSIQGRNDVKIAIRKMADLPVYFAFDAMNISEIQKEISVMVDAYSVAFILLDYLQLARNFDARSREREVGEISMIMKHIANRYQIPMMILSQLNRQVEKRENCVPILSDLRDSGQIEQDADVVMFIYDGDSDKTITIDIAKGRNIALGKVQLYWDRDRMTFRDVVN